MSNHCKLIYIHFDQYDITLLPGLHSLCEQGKVLRKWAVKKERSCNESYCMHEDHRDELCYVKKEKIASRVALDMKN